MTNADFFQTLRCLDIDEDDSILTFRDTLNRPNIDPIFLGCLAGLRCLQLRVCPGQVEMAKQPEDEDEREKVSDIVLGLWSSKEERKAGKQAHEMQPRTRNSPAAPLEVFIQLGLIFSCEADAIPLTAKSECWIPSNYVLVINLEDYSPWILRQSFIKSPGKLESYVDFVDCWNLLPGSDFENISMGRLADSITALNPSVTTPIQVTMVQYKACKNFRPNHNQNSQPVVDCARRTAQGGIRRTNDFTPSEKRNPRDIIA